MQWPPEDSQCYAWLAERIPEPGTVRTKTPRRLFIKGGVVYCWGEGNIL